LKYSKLNNQRIALRLPTEDNHSSNNKALCNVKLKLQTTSKKST